MHEVKPTYSPSMFTKCIDADFYIVMKDMGFTETPREKITVGDFIRYDDILRMERALDKGWSP